MIQDPLRDTHQPPFKCSHTSLTAINTLQATMLTPTNTRHGKVNARLEAHQLQLLLHMHQDCRHTALDQHTEQTLAAAHCVWGAAHCVWGWAAKQVRQEPEAASLQKPETRQASHPHPRASKPSPGQKLSRAQARACQLFKTSQGPTTGLPELAARMVARGREC